MHASLATIKKKVGNYVSGTSGLLLHESNILRETLRILASIVARSCS
jgi:hypothetical protein